MQILDISHEQPNRWTFVTSAAFQPLGFVELETDADGHGLSVSADFAGITLLLIGSRYIFPSWPCILSADEFTIPLGASIASCVAKLDAAWRNAGWGFAYAEPHLFPASDQAACLTGTCEFRCHTRSADNLRYCELGAMTFWPKHSPSEASIGR